MSIRTSDDDLILQFAANGKFQTRLEVLIFSQPVQCLCLQIVSNNIPVSFELSFRHSLRGRGESLPNDASRI